jgi:metal-dependent amidase/aminoacylase/carboxypeptidase family protein
MPIINRIADYHDEMKEWRQHIHRNPELNFDCHKTAAFVVKKLKEFGVDEIHEKIAESGVWTHFHYRRLKIMSINLLLMVKCMHVDMMVTQQCY